MKRRCREIEATEKVLVARLVMDRVLRAKISLTANTCLPWTALFGGLLRQKWVI